LKGVHGDTTTAPDAVQRGLRVMLALVSCRQKGATGYKNGGQCTEVFEWGQHTEASNKPLARGDIRASPPLAGAASPTGAQRAEEGEKSPLQHRQSRAVSPKQSTDPGNSLQCSAAFVRHDGAGSMCRKQLYNNLPKSTRKHARNPHRKTCRMCRTRCQTRAAAASTQARPAACRLLPPAALSSPTDTCGVCASAALAAAPWKGRPTPKTTREAARPRCASHRQCCFFPFFGGGGAQDSKVARRCCAGTRRCGQEHVRAWSYTWAERRAGEAGACWAQGQAQGVVMHAACCSPNCSLGSI
jgi:hypothetical protein